MAGTAEDLPGCVGVVLGILAVGVAGFAYLESGATGGDCEQAILHAEAGSPVFL